MRAFPLPHLKEEGATSCPTCGTLVGDFDKVPCVSSQPDDPDGKPHERICQTNFDAQAPIKIACKCGWQGMSDGLIGSIQSQDLFCPRCKEVFDAWPSDPYAGQLINGESFDGTGYVPEMVERVARVLCAGMGSFTEPNSPDALVRCTDGWNRPRWVLFADHARAVIAAMREPTDEMAQKGVVHLGEDGVGNSVDVWHAMIDQALR